MLEPSSPGRVSRYGKEQSREGDIDVPTCRPRGETVCPGGARIARPASRAFACSPGEVSFANAAPHAQLDAASAATARSPTRHTFRLALNSGFGGFHAAYP